MRLMLAASLLAPLAACGQAEEAARNSFRQADEAPAGSARQSDDAVRNSYRQASIESCVSATRTSVPAQMASYDWPRICACATERLIAGKNPAELARLQSDTPEQRAAFQQCVAEIQGTSPGAPVETPGPAN